MAQQNKTVVIVSKNPSLVTWCNQVLENQFHLIWVKSVECYTFKKAPLAVITDFAPTDFKSVYSFFQEERHIRCFNIASAENFPVSCKRSFSKAKFLEPGNESLLKISIKSQFHFTPLEQNYTIDEYYRKLSCAAKSDETVLLLGSMGAGKTHDAKRIHDLSSRRNRRFISFTMAESNLESIEGDLFGVAKNAFTGVSEKPGLLSQAQGGTIFFDEITEIPLTMQTKLLTVISERKFRPKGGNVQEEFTGRFIFATNADIDSLVKERKFRADLYSRINVLRLRVPDLNEHSEDIAEFAIKYAAEQNKTLTKNAFKLLENFKWTGNIRQLRNVVIRACIFAKSDVVHSRDISFE